MKRFTKILLLLFLLPLPPCYSDDSSPLSGLDWNSANIKWQGYEEGVNQARQSGKPVFIVFFGDWCPVCHSYERVFRDKEVTALSQQWVMIRVDVDQRPDLNSSYDDHGMTYTPRIFAMRSDGVALGIQSDHPEYKQFFVGQPETFRNIMRQGLLLADNQ